MKRCLRRLVQLFTAVVLAQLALSLTHNTLAQTQLRTFPAAAKRAVLEVTQSPEVRLDGAPRRLSPGARIRSANNLLVMPATITGQPLQVKFLPDAQGLIHDVWILSPQEALDTRP